MTIRQVTYWLNEKIDDLNKQILDFDLSVLTDTLPLIFILMIASFYLSVFLRRVSSNRFGAKTATTVVVLISGMDHIKGYLQDNLPEMFLIMAGILVLLLQQKIIDQTFRLSKNILKK